jgi:polyisoprenyl-teichoic acid--peptidoglycan teichoic acid transferase
MDIRKYLVKENLLFALLLLGVFVFGFTATYFTLKFSKLFVPKGLSVQEENTPIPIGTPMDVTPQKGVFNILLLGTGGTGHSGGGLTDSIIVVHVDTNKKTSALISIPRDLWVPGNRKINAEASVNGIQNVGSVVKNVTGLPINYYVAIDFDKFIKMINDLGGIEVTVPKTFSDDFYPVKGLENETCGFTADEINSFKAKYSGFELEKQFACRYERIHFDKGPAELNGETALKFVRSRHGDSDFGRSARQFAILKGIAKKSISGKTIDSLSKLIRTDLNLATIKSLIEVFGDPGAYKVTEIQLTTENVLNEGKSGDGAYILTPKAGNFNFSGIRSYISSQE